MKADPRLAILGDSVSRVRKTAAGDLLLELQRTAKGKTAEFRQQVEGVLEEGTKIRTLQDERAFKIKDLDVLTSKED